MAYQKILVDNIKCYRRFHITFDDETEKAPHVELKCLHCGQIIFARDNHPEVRLARDENLTQTTQMSSNRVQSCQFKDEFSPASKPKL